MMYLRVPKDFKAIDGSSITFIDDGKSTKPNFYEVLRVSIYAFPRSELDMESVVIGSGLIKKIIDARESESKFIKFEQAEYKWLKNNLNMWMPKIWGFNADVLYALFRDNCISEKKWEEESKEENKEELEGLKVPESNEN